MEKLIPQKVFDTHLKHFKKAQQKFSAIAGIKLNNINLEGNELILELFYQNFVQKYSEDTIIRSVDTFTSEKFKAKIRGLMEDSKRYSISGRMAFRKLYKEITHRDVLNIVLSPKLLPYKKNGTIQIPWSDVSFGDGFLIISNIRTDKDKVIEHRHYSVAYSKSYNDLKRFFKDRVPMISVQLEYGEVRKCIVPDIQKYILDIDQSEDVEIVGGKVKLPKVSMPRKISIQELRRRIPVGKSIFIDDLCYLLLEDKKLYRYCEDRINKNQSEREDGFIFQIYCNSRVSIMAFENRKDDRATLVFRFSSAEFEKDLSLVSSFLTSPMENKRQFLVGRESVVINGTELFFRRVTHGENWKSNIIRLVRRFR